VDGLVFVADSQRSRADDNVAAYQDIKELVQEHKMNFEEMPIVFQWNKRDLSDVMGGDELTALLNDREAPSYEAVAIDNVGVIPAFKNIVKLVTTRIGEPSRRR